jgi:hypothetical protein
MKPYRNIYADNGERRQIVPRQIPSSKNLASVSAWITMAV